MLPVVMRARGYHLYTQKGDRLLDMYLNNGALIFGHNPESQVRKLKNLLSRGLVTSLPSILGERLKQSLANILPAHSYFGIANSVEDALSVVSQKFGIRRSVSVIDPLTNVSWSSATVAWWRPLSNSQPIGGAWLLDGPPLLFHKLPFRIGAGPITWSARKDKRLYVKNAINENINDQYLFGADITPGFLIAGVIDAIERLIKVKKDYNSLASKIWDQTPMGWQRDGVYLSPMFSSAQYKKLYTKFLSEGVLINPNKHQPTIIPPKLTEGEISLINRLFNSLSLIEKS